MGITCAQILKIDLAAWDPPDDPDNTFSQDKGFVWTSCILDKKKGEKRQ